MTGLTLGLYHYDFCHWWLTELVWSFCSLLNLQVHTTSSEKALSPFFHLQFWFLSVPPISSEVFGSVVEAGRLFLPFLIYNFECSIHFFRGPYVGCWVCQTICPFFHLQFWFLSVPSISSEVSGSVVEAGRLFLPFLIYGFTFVLLVVISGGGLSMEYVNKDRKWPHLVW